MFELVEIDTLIRHDRTIGIGRFEDFEFCTLELPWRFNQKNKSCIPAGTYDVVRINNHPRFGTCFEILNVPDRTEIMIHKGNFTRDIEGCILIGNGIKDVDNDGTLDVMNSTATIQRLWAMLSDRFVLTIRRHG